MRVKNHSISILCYFCGLKIQSGKEENLALGRTGAIILNMGDQLYFNEKRARVILSIPGWLSQNTDNIHLSVTNCHQKYSQTEQEKYIISLNYRVMRKRNSRFSFSIC